MIPIAWTEPAIDDLQGILDYISASSPVYAQDVIVVHGTMDIAGMRPRPWNRRQVRVWSPAPSRPRPHGSSQSLRSVERVRVARDVDGSLAAEACDARLHELVAHGNRRSLLGEA